MPHIYVGPNEPRCNLGKLLVSKDIMESVPLEEISAALARHVRGDYGDAPDDIARENDVAITSGGNVFSRFYDSEGFPFGIATDIEQGTTLVLTYDLMLELRERVKEP